jgi:hypothetical protein
MRKILLGFAAVSMTAPALPSIASADHRHAANYSRYNDNGGYYNGPTWQGQDGRTYCRRSNGTTGLIVGGAGGAFVGRALDGGRSSTTGTVIGAAVGALLGREVQRSRSRCR